MRVHTPTVIYQQNNAAMGLLKGVRVPCFSNPATPYFPSELDSIEPVKARALQHVLIIQPFCARLGSFPWISLASGYAMAGSLDGLMTNPLYSDCERYALPPVARFNCCVYVFILFRCCRREMSSFRCLRWLCVARRRPSVHQISCCEP